MLVGSSVVLVVVLLFLLSSVDAYDPLDPSGNITVRWDVREWDDTHDGYVADVSIFNNQLYRHIEKPGWKLGWQWPGDQVIWSVHGAEATEQGDCSRFRGGVGIPHCCKKDPVLVDLLPGDDDISIIANCCRGGVLSSMSQSLPGSFAVFRISVGGTVLQHNTTKEGDNKTSYSYEIVNTPEKFHLDVPGYTCGPLVNTTPTTYPQHGGRRKTQAFQTWKVECTYSSMLARAAPSCCVSLSAFYNDTIIPCPRCSCACQTDPPTVKCLDSDHGQVIQQPPPPDEGLKEVQPVVVCSRHMCPIHVHWHVKVSYKEYWRVKMTVANMNLVANYTDWNLVVQHPGLDQLVRVFSFNYKSLDVFPQINDSGVFWGIRTYNDLLLQHGADGNVQTEMLLRKDPDTFTFGAGWAFPRRIYFNGEQCVMPPPDSYPHLPNGALSALPSCSSAAAAVLLSSLVFFFLQNWTV